METIRTEVKEKKSKVPRNVSAEAPQDASITNAGTVTYNFQSAPCMVREYDIASLDDNEENHFHRMEGERWEAFVGSIREYGVLSPLIVRAKAGTSGRYEILAGHNRKSGAMEAGLKTVPCIAVDVDDVDASVLIGVTNRQREEVSDLEWGWTYRTTLEMMKHQGIRAKADASGGAQPGEAQTSGAQRGGERSIDVVARKYGVNRKTVRSKIRLTYLIPQLYEYGRKQKYTQKMMIDLSYLPPELQTNVVQAAVIEKIVLTESAAAALRKAAAATLKKTDTSESLTINDVLRICREEASNDDAGSPRRRALKYEVSEDLFPKDLPKSSRQSYVTAALEYIREQRIELDLG